MKKILFILSLLLLPQSYTFAQDTVITNNGDVLQVYEIEISESSIFYKKAPGDEASLKLNKADVLMIKYRNGNVVRMDSAASTTNTTTAPAESDSVATPTTEMDEKLAADNLQLVQKFNTLDVKYLGERKKPNRKVGFKAVDDAFLVILGLKEGSIIETPELKANFGIVKIDPKGRIHEFDGTLWYLSTFGLAVTLQNKSDKTIYVDLGTSYFILGGEAVPYYIPQATSTTKGHGTGASVNLGAIAGAAGIGGAVGTLASGINVGGGQSSSTSTTTYSQRIISIPPMSSKSLEVKSIEEDYAGENKNYGGTKKTAILKQYTGYLKEQGYLEEKSKRYDLSLPEDMFIGDKIDIPDLEDVRPLSLFITYAMDEAQTNPQSMPINFRVRQFMCIPSLTVFTKEMEYKQCPLFFYIHYKKGLPK